MSRNILNSGIHFINIRVIRWNKFTKVLSCFSKCINAFVHSCFVFIKFNVVIKVYLLYQYTQRKCIGRETLLVDFDITTLEVAMSAWMQGKFFILNFSNRVWYFSCWRTCELDLVVFSVIKRAVAEISGLCIQVFI